MGVFEELYKCYPELGPAKGAIEKARDLIVTSYKEKGKVLTCGNGGSAADAEHIVGELLKSFEARRLLSNEVVSRIKDNCGDEAGGFIQNLEMPLPAIALTSHPSFTTAYANDVDPKYVFAQQLLGLGRSGDVLIAISTSGCSKNVVLAAKLALALEICTIGMTGSTGGELAEICDVCIRVPADRTYRAQEYHLAVYHAICRCVENTFFDNPDTD